MKLKIMYPFFTHYLRQSNQNQVIMSTHEETMGEGTFVSFIQDRLGSLLLVIVLAKEQCNEGCVGGTIAN